MAESLFYDLNIHLNAEDSDVLNNFSFLAKHLGYSGIAISGVENASKLTRSVNIDDFNLFSSVELKVANASKLHGQIGKYRNKVDVIAVHGGSESINRAAVENPNVDVLVKMATPKDNGFNHVLAKEAADHNVAISFDLGDLIHLRGGRRVHSLMNFRKNLLLVRKYDVPFILTSNAVSIFDMRAPREMIALAGLFGMTREEAISGISDNPRSIALKKSQLQGYVMEGVQELDSSCLSGDIGGEFI